MIDCETAFKEFFREKIVPVETKSATAFKSSEIMELMEFTFRHAWILRNVEVDAFKKALEFYSTAENLVISPQGELFEHRPGKLDIYGTTANKVLQVRED